MFDRGRTSAKIHGNIRNEEENRSQWRTLTKLLQRVARSRAPEEKTGAATVAELEIELNATKRSLRDLIQRLTDITGGGV